MKNKILYPAFIVCVSIILISCNKETVYEPDITLQRPIAAFSYTGSDGPPPVVVDFKNESETIIQDSCSYLWTFGQNGPNSSDKDPSFTFNNASSSPKIYLVTLKVTDLVSGLSHTNSAGVEIQGRTGGKQE